MSQFGSDHTHEELVRKEVADVWTAYPAVPVPAKASAPTKSGFVQIVGTRQFRDDLLIVNRGPNDCYISDQPEGAGGAVGVSPPGLLLPNGGSYEFAAKTAVYAMSVLGTTLDILETYWNSPLQ